MSDVQFLFAILGGLYLWECACWVRGGGVALSRWFGTAWRLQHPAAMLGNQRGGFVLAPPLPPLGEIHSAYQFPFSLGPAGVLFFVATNVNPGGRPPQSGRFLSWDQVAALQLKGKKIKLGGELIFAAPGVMFARYLHELLVAIAVEQPVARDQAIFKAVTSSFDSQQIRARLAKFQRQAKWIPGLANALFLLLFVVAPLLIWFVGLKLTWAGLLIGILGLTITIAVCFHRVHRTFYPAAEDDRFTQTFIIALAPATAIRAADIVSRPLLERFHPLAVAGVLLPERDFRRFARRFLIHLRHPAEPVCPHLQPPAVATESFFRQQMLQVVEAWLRERKVSPEELGRPPEPADETCRAYCPRCEAQFTAATGVCADCGGIPRRAFSKPS